MFTGKTPTWPTERTIASTVSTSFRFTEFKHKIPSGMIGKRRHGRRAWLRVFIVSVNSIIVCFLSSACSKFESFFSSKYTMNSFYYKTCEYRNGWELNRATRFLKSPKYCLMRWRLSRMRTWSLATNLGERGLKQAHLDPNFRPINARYLVPRRPSSNSMAQCI